MPRVYVFYKHYVFNRNKAKLFTTFLEPSDRGKYFIPRKYREKVSTITNKEVLKTKRKETLQKMRNDIDCMTEYADSHQTKVLEIEQHLNNSACNDDTDPVLATQILVLIQGQFDDHKQRSVREWEGKERFFLKLQQEFLEKEPAAQSSSKEEEDSLVQLLMEIGDEPPSNYHEEERTAQPKPASKPNPAAKPKQTPNNRKAANNRQTNCDRKQASRPSSPRPERDSKRPYQRQSRNYERSQERDRRQYFYSRERGRSPRHHAQERELTPRFDRYNFTAPRSNQWMNHYQDSGNYIPHSPRPTLGTCPFSPRTPIMITQPRHNIIF